MAARTDEVDVTAANSTVSIIMDAINMVGRAKPLKR